MFWLPLIGPILQGVASIFSGYFSEKAQISVAETQASAQIIHDTSDDILLRIIRDLMILPGAAWFALGGWDTIIAHSHPEWRIIVSEFPPQLAYYPYAVLVFLLGNIGLNMWNRK